MTSRKIRVPETICPTCGKKLDTCSTVEGLDSPSANDLTVCIGCGELLEFDKGLKLRLLTPEKLFQISLSDPEAYANCLQFRAAILLLKENRHEPKP